METKIEITAERGGITEVVSDLTFVESLTRTGMVAEGLRVLARDIEIRAEEGFTNFRLNAKTV